MNKKNIWIVASMSRPLKGCLLDSDGAEFYYVDCLIPAKNSEEATGTMVHLLRNKQLDLAEILKCERYNPKSWKSSMQFEQIEKAAEHARNKGEPKFALFISSDALDFDEDKETDNDEVEWD
ncbi:hypothetical protein ACJJIK_02275 [Microbulbifer sp. ZKSA006]|uniref:hypothetical protein n=1 Tax=Microbulbifer sp. ZKSA006 TaxID=3243390 RepID=UPI004039CF50